jgi:hypothetical protein
MATTAFQLLSPQDALIVGDQKLKSDVSSPVNGMAVALSGGYLVTATNEQAIGLLCEIPQMLTGSMHPWDLYERTNANALDAWKGEYCAYLVRGLVRLPAASVASYAVGAKIEVVNGGTYSVCSDKVGVGTVIATNTDQDGTITVDCFFDFAQGSVLAT